MPFILQVHPHLTPEALVERFKWCKNAGERLRLQAVMLKCRVQKLCRVEIQKFWRILTRQPLLAISGSCWVSRWRPRRCSTS